MIMLFWDPGVRHPFWPAVLNFFLACLDGGLPNLVQRRLIFPIASKRLAFPSMWADWARTWYCLTTPHRGAANAILASKKLSHKDALKHRGRLQFTSGQVFGRVVKAALFVKTMRAYQSRCGDVFEDIAFGLKLRKRFLSQGKPRRLKNSPPFLQIDACFDSRLLEEFFSTTKGRSWFFFCWVGSATIGCFDSQPETNYPFWMRVFCPFLRAVSMGDIVGPALVIYAGNNAVRDSMISCHANNFIAKKILVATLAVEFCRCAILFGYKKPSIVRNFSIWLWSKQSLGSCFSLVWKVGRWTGRIVTFWKMCISERCGEQYSSGHTWKPVIAKPKAKLFVSDLDQGVNVTTNKFQQCIHGFQLILQMFNWCHFSHSNVLSFENCVRPTLKLPSGTSLGIHFVYKLFHFVSLLAKPDAWWTGRIVTPVENVCISERRGEQ